MSGKQFVCRKKFENLSALIDGENFKFELAGFNDLPYRD